MKINSVDNQTNFGWRYKTHEKITGIILDEFPKLTKYKDTLTEFVVKPDFDERGFKGNNHFYFVPQTFYPRESFFDITGSNNAASRYDGHMYLFNRLINKDNPGAMEHAGRALHFLQDMTQPMHTARGNIFKKWRDLKVHKEFENYTLDKQDKFISNAIHDNLGHADWYKDFRYDDRYDLFEKHVRSSNEMQVPDKSNRFLWAYIAQSGIHSAVDATRAFLNIISSCIK